MGLMADNHNHVWTTALYLYENPQISFSPATGIEWVCDCGHREARGIFNDLPKEGSMGMQLHKDIVAKYQRDLDSQHEYIKSIESRLPPQEED